MKVLNYLLTIFCIAFGITIGFYLLNGYDNKEKISLVHLSKEELIFFKYKEYTSEEEMKKDTLNLDSYIYTKNDDQYIVYLAITKNEKNVDKIKGYFEKKGYVISEEKITVSNESLLKQIDDYDLLLANTEKEDGVLEKYEEAQVEN